MDKRRLLTAGIMASALSLTGWAQETPEEPPAPAAEPAAETPPEAAPETIAVDAPAPEAPASSATVLEDVVVTAQKRVQSIQDVPVSMSAMNAEFIHEQGLTDIRDAMALMPNVKMEEAGFFTAPRIRGFTFNNNNKAFEPPVGIVVDGVPYTRPEYFMMTLFDIDRVEVMRGPQGTTFGKNTTAGLVHLMTKGPSSSPEGRLQLQGGELNRKHIEAAYGGGLTEGLDFRVAGLYDERDGFIRNTFHDVDPTVPEAYKNRKRTGGRIKLEMPDLFGSDLKIGVEQVSLLSGGAAFEYVEITPDFDTACRRYDPGFDAIPGNWTDTEDFPGFRDVRISTTNGEWTDDFGGWNVVAVGGHSVMTQDLQLDVDFSPAPSTIGFGSDRSPTSTLELRTTSPTFDGLLGISNPFGWNPGSTDLLVGVFYEKREILDSVFRFGVNDQATLELVQGANGNTGTGLGGGGGEFGGLTANDVQQNYEEVVQLFNQHAQAVGAFTHLKWQFLPSWAAEAGVRYTTEKKDADWDLHFTTMGANTLMGRLGFIPFTDALTRDEDNIQPKFSLDYALTDNIKLFAHWTRGYKGGGYNAFAYRNVEDDGTTHTTTDLQYEPEITTEKGFDIKTTLFGGAARANLSLYDMQAKDFQVLVRNNPSGTIGLGTTQVENAEGASARGAEFDLTWLVTDWFTVIGASGLNETKYLKFTHNDCPSEVPNAEKPCDATGKRFPYSPLWNNALSLVTNLGFERLPLVGGWLGNTGLELFASVTGEHQTWSYLDTDLSERPSKIQPEFYRLKANVGIGNPARRWTFRVIGENLNNSVTWIRAGDIFANEIAASQNEPKLIFAQFQQEF
jgi:outer membrane receptor protein involved in Fe transport